MLFHEPINHFINAPQLIRIGRLGRSRYLHHVFEVSKDLLLDRFLQTLMRVVLERLALPSVGRNTNQYLLAESVLGILGDPDLLLDRAHQLFVRIHLLFSDWIFDSLFVAERLNVVEIVVAHRARHLFERVDKRALHFDLCQLVIFFARLRDVVQITLALFAADAGVLFETVFDCSQRVDRIDAGDAVTHQRARKPIDDVAR